MKQFLARAGLTLPLAAAGAYFRELLPALIALAAVMVSDYVTGMLSAWTRRTLSSGIGWCRPRRSGWARPSGAFTSSGCW